MNNSISIVAGGAGFIGANLVPRLLESGRSVVVADNFSRGASLNLGSAVDHPAFHLRETDLADRAATASVFEFARSLGEITEVWHLAANSDIPAGVKNPDVDFKDTFCTTFELLRAMQAHGVRHLHFASSSAIYGDLGDAVLHEAIGPLLPISNYGAMKLASEAQASAAAESFLERVNLFRFPNVVGVPATHGVLLDFVKKLAATPRELQVLGDGTQQKAYLHVSDLVDAMLAIRDRARDHKFEVVNIGPTDTGVTVKWIAEQVVARVSPGSAIAYGVGNKGWVGDVPKFNYSTARLQSYGWVPRLGSAAAITRSIDDIARELGF
jgi:UDP-glucose 4-epimerase